jgi:hypothetical protein
MIHLPRTEGVSKWLAHAPENQTARGTAGRPLTRARTPSNLSDMTMRVRQAARSTCGFGMELPSRGEETGC